MRPDCRDTRMTAALGKGVLKLLAALLERWAQLRTIPAPDDADTVLTALQLGWCVAEVRGRNRLNAPAGPEAGLPNRADQALPLPVEQTPAERRVPAQAVMTVLAGRLGVDSDADGASFASQINAKANTLATLPKNDSGARAQWNAFTELIYRFDAHIQSVLTANSEIQAAGYVLGRGLAECYWSLDPRLPEGPSPPSAWWFLFSDQRCKELNRLLARLSDYMKPYAAPAIADSLDDWKAVAVNPQQRLQAQSALYAQVCVWHELTALGRDPTNFIKPHSHAPRLHVIGEGIGFFWGRVTLTLVGLAAAIALVAVLGTGNGNAVSSTLLAVLAATGISTAVLSANRFRQDTLTDIAGLAGTTFQPGTSRPTRTHPQRRPGPPGTGRPAWARRGRRIGERPPRDWVAITASSLPGLAAVVALIFTGLQVHATNGQLQETKNQLHIAEQGQITDRYNAAIANLGSSSIDIRQGGIYALQRLMQDSPRDQPTVIAELCAFAREPTASNPKPQESSAPSLPTDVQAALTVAGTRNTANDGRTTLIDLNHAPLADAQLEYLRLAGANLAGAALAGADINYTHLASASLAGADVAGADLIYTQLADANLSGANLTMAHLTNTDLTRADLSHVNLTGAVLAGANLTGASFFGANLTGAVLAGENLPYLSFATATLSGADLTGADLTHGDLIAAVLAGAGFANATLSGADLSGADLSGADLRQATLTGADLSYADLTGADLYGAGLIGANLTGADLTGAHPYLARLTGANLTGARWPHGATVPQGWQRNPGSDRLEQAGH